jgi:hypothetical protein
MADQINFYKNAKYISIIVLTLLSYNNGMMQQSKRYMAQTQTGLHEYLLAVYPDTMVSDKIMVEKNYFKKQYLREHDPYTKPQITIASFMAYQAMEETILRYSQRICSRQQSFEVALNNYSGIPPHTIYLRVQNPEPFFEITRELKVIGEYISSCSCPPIKLVSNPHISISTPLSGSIYCEAMLEYSQKLFHEIFKVEELILLRRSNEYDTYKTVHVFRLQPAQPTLVANYY